MPFGPSAKIEFTKKLDKAHDALENVLIDIESLEDRELESELVSDTYEIFDKAVKETKKAKEWSSKMVPYKAQAAIEKAILGAKASALAAAKVEAASQDYTGKTFALSLAGMKTAFLVRKIQDNEALVLDSTGKDTKVPVRYIEEWLKDGCLKQTDKLAAAKTVVALNQEEYAKELGKQLMESKLTIHSILDGGKFGPEEIRNHDDIKK